MTALFLQIALVAGVSAYVGWAAREIAHGAAAWAFVAAAPIVYFAPAIVLVGVWSTLTWIWRTPRPPEARIGPMATARLFLTEVWTLGVSWPLMALHGLFMRDPHAAPSTRPVLLVHGVLVNEGVWFFLRRGLERRGIASIYTLSYGPPFDDIEHFAEQLDGKINRICAATGAKQAMLVCHSMGGLVARAYLRRFGASRVTKVVTIGTPHHGSVLAWGFPGRGLEQMRPGNAWLAELNRHEREAAPVPITSIWSRHDSMVGPQASGELACATNLALVGVGHNALLIDRQAIELVAKILETPHLARAERHADASS
jgi:triacylglycerol esterase/lipase EstA (alpha/beta hydrolase family)